MRQETASLSMVGADIVEEKENLSNNEVEKKLEKAKDFLGVIKGVDITNEQIKEVRALSRLRT